MISKKRVSLSIVAALGAAAFAGNIGLGFWSVALGGAVLVSSLKLNYLILVLIIFLPFKYSLQGLGLPPLLLTVFSPALLLLGISIEVFENHLSDKVKFKQEDIFLLIFFGSSLVSTAFFSFEFGFRNHQVLDFFVFAHLAGFYLCGRLLASVDKIALANMVVATLVAALGIFQAILGPENKIWVEAFDPVSARVYGPLGNPNAFSGYLLLSLIWAATVKLKSEIKLISLTIITTGIILSYSRGALIATMIIVVTHLILEKKYKKLGAIFVLGLSLLPIFFSKLISRFYLLFSSDYFYSSATSGRIWALKNVIYINSKSLFQVFFGNGWGSYGGEYAYGNLSPIYEKGIQGGVIGVANTDNQWLQTFAQQGILGVVSLLFFFGFVFIDNVKNNKSAYVILAGLILMIFVDVFQFYQVAFLLFLVTGILSGYNKRRV